MKSNLLFLTIFAAIVLANPIDYSNLLKRQLEFPPGEVCAFNARDNAARQGHIAWGFQYNATIYIYGSDDGPLPNSKKKKWIEVFGTRSEMLEFFRDYLLDGHHYTYYNCEKVND